MNSSSISGHAYIMGNLNLSKSSVSGSVRTEANVTLENNAGLYDSAILAEGSFVNNSRIGGDSRVGERTQVVNGLSIVDSIISGEIFRVITENKNSARCDGINDELERDSCNP